MEGAFVDVPVRISIVEFPSGDIAFDERLGPPGPARKIIYRVSGAAGEDTLTTSWMLHDFYTWTSENVGPDTILLLHGHVNQLLAVMTAPTNNIVDTSPLFRRVGLPSAESSLTQLAETYLPGGLNRTERHSSVDDASLIVELVQWVLQNGAYHTLYDGTPN